MVIEPITLRPPGVITTTLHDIADMLRISATRRDRRWGIPAGGIGGAWLGMGHMGHGLVGDIIINDNTGWW